MIDFFRRIFEKLLRELLLQERYHELSSSEVERILLTVESVLDAPTLVQGARGVLELLDETEPRGGESS